MGCWTVLGGLSKSSNAEGPRERCGPSVGAAIEHAGRPARSVAEPEPDKLSRTALHPGSLHALSRGSWHVGTLARVAQPKRVRLQVERLFDRHEAPARGCASRAVRRLVGHATLSSRVLNQDMCCSRVLNARSTCVASRIVDRRSVPTQPLWTSARPSQAAVLSSCRTAWLSPSGGSATRVSRVY